MFLIFKALIIIHSKKMLINNTGNKTIILEEGYYSKRFKSELNIKE